MMHTYDVEMTDTYAGEANYAWVRRAKVTMPELTHYGYDGSTNYVAANRVFTRELMRKAKAAMQITGAKGQRETWGDTEVLRLRGAGIIMFVSHCDE